uniref:Phasin family protein n=1 Tax=Candidatus Kentrum sp. LFY TaxID=2126342 RepID=A0A450UNA4_9GAMM|nr:MAG: phasin family protein [Candidatus Kentron sp. LFY]VFJ94822.1 MAG: phasin family protein [Candidatus Kentron sp. LFY]VFK19111.1 MAG: phasin family protein [Candidatus Kentron sp. LFY]
MVTRKDEAASGKEAAGRMSVQEVEAASQKKAVSPLERWAMTAEAAYYRAQKRGFIGGNPMDDWMEAEKEIDAAYIVDYGRIMTLLDPSEMMEQFGKVFNGAVGQPNLHLNEALEKQRDNVEALARANKRIFDDAREMMERQTQMFRNMMGQVISPMERKVKSTSSRTTVQQAELIHLGVEKSLDSMRETAESIAKANMEVFDTAKQRIEESMSTFKQLAQKLASGK